MATTTATLSLPTLLLGLGPNAQAAIVDAFKKLDDEVTDLRARLDVLEAAE